MASLTTSTDNSKAKVALRKLKEASDTAADAAILVQDKEWELQVKLNAVKIDQNEGEPKTIDVFEEGETKTEETTEEASPIVIISAGEDKLELLTKWRANYKHFKEKCGAPNRVEMSNSDGGMKIFFVLLSMKLIEVDVLPSMKFCDFLRMYAEKTGEDMPNDLYAKTNRFVFASKSLGSNDRTFAEYNIENNDMILVLHQERAG